jgi:glycosyltransferase involved in cell wall biosynthesis
VLFEAMAAGTPFVSVAAGNAAEIAEWSGGGLVVATTQRRDGTVTADPDDLAGAIERLVHDRGEARRLGDAGRTAWQREFTWESISRQYEDLYEEVVR